MTSKRMGLEGLVLVEQSRLTLAAAILRSLEEAFGPQAGIVLDDPVAKACGHGSVRTQCPGDQTEPGP